MNLEQETSSERQSSRGRRFRLSGLEKGSKRIELEDINSNKKFVFKDALSALVSMVKLDYTRQRARVKDSPFVFGRGRNVLHDGFVRSVENGLIKKEGENGDGRTKTR